MRQVRRRLCVWLCAGLSLICGTPQALAESGIGIELNKVVDAEQKCRTYIVVEERDGQPLQSLKADFVVFAKDGSVSKRVAAELGPVRSRKTSVKIFDIDSACGDISGLLLNDLLACEPAASIEACLDRISVTSRVPVRFFK